MTSGGTEENESLDELFREIWERESQPELSFPVNGVGSVSVMCPCTESTAASLCPTACSS